jgi:hypothetical protein
MSDDKKIALLFLTYEHIVHRKNRILKSYLDNTHVYIHPKRPEKITDEFKNNIIPHRIDTEWGGDSIVIATLLLLREAYKNNANAWFVLCSEDIFPLRTYAEFQSYLGTRERSIFALMQNDTKIANSSIVKTQQWWALTREDVGRLLHSLNIQEYNDEPSKIAAYIQKQTIFTTIQTNKPKSAAVLDEWFFLSALKIDYKTRHKKGSFHYDSAMICYTKWFPWISKHPTVFNRLLPNDKEYIDTHESCFFIRKTFPTFENKVVGKGRKNGIVVVIGTKNQHIPDYGQFLSRYENNSDIFLLVMIDNLADISSDIKKACCACYSVVWSKVEDACSSLRQFMSRYYTNVMIIPENQNANDWKDPSHETSSTKKSDWVKRKSETQDTYYWYNEKTGRSSWDKPDSIGRKTRRKYT